MDLSYINVGFDIQVNTTIYSMGVIKPENQQGPQYNATFYGRNLCLEQVNKELPQDYEKETEIQVDEEDIKISEVVLDLIKKVTDNIDNKELVEVIKTETDTSNNF